jgi:hypothetical protein
LQSELSGWKVADCFLHYRYYLYNLPILFSDQDKHLDFSKIIQLISFLLSNHLILFQNKDFQWYTIY